MQRSRKLLTVTYNSRMNHGNVQNVNIERVAVCPLVVLGVLSRRVGQPDPPHAGSEPRDFAQNKVLQISCITLTNNS